MLDLKFHPLSNDVYSSYGYFNFKNIIAFEKNLSQEQKLDCYLYGRPCSLSIFLALTFVEYLWLFHFEILVFTFHRNTGIDHLN
jgi:hypothetical protein